MGTVIRDTHRLISLLQESGYTAEQAEGFTRVLQQLELDELVTKGDLETELSRQLAQLETRLTTRMATFIGVAVAIIAALKLL